jgi:hypothetical protein
MTVTYRPANLKGITAGALRQVKQQGSTTAAGGWHLEDTIHKFAADTTLYLKPNEPLGGYMTSLKTAVEDTETMTEALLKHANSMVEQARETKHAESLVNSLERLAVLEASGTLDKVMKAMSK